MTHASGRVAARRTRRPETNDWFLDRIGGMAITLLPLAAYMTIWISPSPGDPGQMHAQRVLSVAVILLAGLASLKLWAVAVNRVKALAMLSVFLVFGGAFWLGQDGVTPTKYVAQVSACLGATAVALLLSRPRGLDHLRAGFVWGSLSVCFVGLVELLTNTHLEDVAGRTWIYGRALGATFVNPNNFACHAIGMIGFLFLAGRDQVASSLLYRGAGSILVVLCLFTNSRSALLGVSLLGLIWLASRARMRWSVILPNALLLGLGLGVLLAVARAMGLMAQFGIYSQGASASDHKRWAAMARAVQLLVESHGLGIGPGKFALLSQGMFGWGTVMDVHNSYLELAVSYGVIPGVLLIVIICGAGLELVRGLRVGDPLAPWGLVALLAHLLGGLAASSMLADPAWWLELVLAVACTAKIRTSLFVDEASALS